jgi:putative nucleotidyltransferase with HDIG domain
VVGRVLFVDRDRKLLGKLEQALRTARGDWSIVCAMSAADACDQISQRPFDVVLADIDVRAADGTSFLDEVARRQPNAVRFLLSKSAGRGMLVRADDAAHQFLAKPLEPDAVFARLAETLLLGELLSDPDLKALVTRLKSVPSLPPAYLAMMAELRKDQASPRKVGDLVARDAGMSAKILQLVNSPLFGFRMRIGDPVQAVQLLGIEAVRGLALSSNIFSQLDLKTVARFGLGRVWRHSMATAGFARVIARRQQEAADIVGEAFTAALLHDIGKLVLASSMPEDYSVVVEQAASDHVPTWLVERDVLGTTHAEVGAYLLGLWGLPEPIVAGVAWHHRPSESAAPSYCPLGAVHAGNVIEHQAHPADTVGVASTADDAYLDHFHMRAEFPAWTAACLDAAVA